MWVKLGQKGKYQKYQEDIEENQKKQQETDMNKVSGSCSTQRETHGKCRKGGG
jgi:hypothetical protein